MSLVIVPSDGKPEIAPRRSEEYREPSRSSAEARQKHAGVLGVFGESIANKKLQTGGVTYSFGFYFFRRERTRASSDNGSASPCPRQV
jgi:hypothetical protein